MHQNQYLPNSFAPHRNWIVDCLSSINSPKAWVLSNEKWTLKLSNRSSQRIEHLEYILTSQTQLGILGFAAYLNSTAPYTILYLYDGSVFSHSIFQPMKTSSEGIPSTSEYKENWWIEPWSIEHLLY